MTGSSASMYCRSCEYPLSHGLAGICPECGRAFDPAVPPSYDSRPRARRRRWVRRGVAVLGLLVVVELVAPSRVAKLTWSWPNQDGATATSETKWCLVAPRWMSVKYPKWTSARWIKPIEPQGLVVSEEAFWRIGLFWVWADGSAVMRVPANSMGMVYGTLGTRNAAGGQNAYEMMPENLDLLCDLLLYPNPDAGQLDYSVRMVPKRIDGRATSQPNGK